MTKELMSLAEITRIEERGFTSITKIEDELRRLLETAKAAHEYKADSEFVRRDSQMRINFLTEKLISLEVLKSAKESIKEIIDDLALRARADDDGTLDISQGVLRRAYETLAKIDALEKL